MLEAGGQSGEKPQGERRKALLAAKARVPVTGFLDYRAYLGALYGEAKRALPRYSYLKFAEDLGFSATNVLRLVIGGRRLLTAAAARRIIEALSLRREERLYLLELIAFQNTKLPAKKQARLAKLMRLKTQVAGDVDRSKLEYFDSWVHPVVREMIRMPGFEPSAEWIATHLHHKVLPDRVAESLRLLKRLGLVVEGPDGALRQTEAGAIVLEADEAAGRIAALRLHEQVLDVAKAGLTVVPQPETEVNALTICVSEAVFEKIRTKIQTLCEDILDLERLPQTRDGVAQVSFQLFNLTKRSPGPRGE